VEGYQRACGLLLQMHESLMTSLKQRQDEAAVSISQLDRLSAELRERVRELEKNAADHDSSARIWSAWGALLALPTLGIGSMLCEHQALMRRAEVRTCTSTLTKKKNKFSSYIRKFRVEQLQSHI
jgi:hypothetical protein